MSYLLDTDVVANALKGRQRDVDLVKRLSSQDLFISIITYGEIYEGIYFGRNPQNDEKVFQQFLRSVDVIPLSRLIMRRFARIRGQLRKAGALISDSDLLIGTTALQHSLTVVTHNTKHFQRIPGIILY
jgi:tRNA(fMet)-specific endonuclease VapC